MIHQNDLNTNSTKFEYRHIGTLTR